MVEWSALLHFMQESRVQFPYELSYPSGITKPSSMKLVTSEIPSPPNKERGENHKWYKRTSIKAYLLLQGLRLVVEIKYMAHKPLSTSLLNQASRAHCLNTCTVTVSENCTKARCNISQIHFKLHFPFQDSVQGHQKSEKPKMDSVCLSVTCFAKSLTLSEVEIFL